MVSTRKKKNQNKKQLNWSKETLDDLVIGNGTNVSAMGNETLEPRTDDQHNNFERIVDSGSQNRYIGYSIDDKNRSAVDNAVMGVEYCMHDAILTAMENRVIPRVEMAVRSTTSSSGNGPSNTVHNPDRKDSTGETVMSLFLL